MLQLQIPNDAINNKSKLKPGLETCANTRVLSGVKPCGMSVYITQVSTPTGLYLIPQWSPSKH